MPSFEGKRVLVTGSTRGIGRATAGRFVSEAARVALNGRSDEAVAAVCREIGDAAVPVPGDVATKAAVVGITRTFAQELAPDIRVNCVCPAIIDTDMGRKNTEIGGHEGSFEDLADIYIP